MEDELSQPATQLIIDPRRIGHQNSGLDEDDLTDIFCILHPASMPACLATAKIAKDYPEHTISNTGVELKIRGVKNDSVKVLTTVDLATRGVASRDIALRLSADVKDPLIGFRFGRHSQRCDFVVCDSNLEAAKKISNVHFRIYITEHGVIMLEDQSTNGTQVENILLRSKTTQNKHTLQQGSLITIPMIDPDEDVKFIVRVPQREGVYEVTYYQNLDNYFRRLNQLSQARAAARGLPNKLIQTPKTAAAVHKGPPDIFAPMTQQASSSIVGSTEASKYVKEWRGGSKYNKVGIIGKGAFATVHLITQKYDGIPYAAKELQKRRFMKNGILDQKVDMEIKIMRKISHPNIVQFIEHIDWDEYLYLIMEYVPCGDLGTLVPQRERLDELTVKNMASQLVGALKYLHGIGVTHRDVKPDNILIHSHDPFHVKLTDFGLSKMVEGTETFLRTFCGTLLYCAPEVYTEYGQYDSNGHRTLRGKDRKSLPQQRYDQSVDFWSLGSVLFYSLCGSPPYPAESGTTHQDLLSSIMTKPLDIRPLQRANVSEAAIRFIRSMLQVKSQHRASVEELEASSWLAEIQLTSADEDDEVDLIGGAADLEEGTSQMTIHSANELDMYDFQENETEIADSVMMESCCEIQHNFTPSGSVSSESFSYLQNPPGTTRLFGEVNASALGSSGVIPEERLNLPLSGSASEDGHHEIASQLNLSSNSMSLQIDQPPDSSAMAEDSPSPAPAMTHRTRLQKPLANSMELTKAAPSLFGAESMVGQLQVNSPSLRVSASLLDPPLPETRDSMISLRHPRDEPELGEECRPAVKRMRSTREIEIPVFKSQFWDHKDKSTWHQDYPDLTHEEFVELQSLAEEQGEAFVPRGKVFEEFLGRYRRTQSTEKEKKSRAQSEPTVEQGRKTMTKRDEERLGDAGKEQPSSLSYSESSIMNGSDVAPVANHASQANTATSLTEELAFKPPQRILGRFTSTSDSAIPSIKLTITEPFTSWGRHYHNSIVFPDKKEIRIPKFAFKLVLWTQDLSTEGSPDLTEGQSFWISTKATKGVWVNGVLLRSHDCNMSDSPSKIWGQLRHGDEVIVLKTGVSTQPDVKLRFESCLGGSQTARPEGAAAFTILPIGKETVQLDAYCTQKEDELRPMAVMNWQAALKAKKRQASSANPSMAEESLSFPPSVTG